MLYPLSYGGGPPCGSSGLRVRIRDSGCIAYRSAEDRPAGEPSHRGNRGRTIRRMVVSELPSMETPALEVP